MGSVRLGLLGGRVSRGLIEADASSTPSFVNSDAILSGDDACSLTLLTKSDPPVSLLRSASSLSSTSSSAMGEPGTVILRMERRRSATLWPNRSRVVM